MSKDVAKTQVIFDGQPQAVEGELIGLQFDTDKGSRTIYTLLENGEELTEERIDRAAQAALTDIWLNNSCVYDRLSNFIFEQKYPHTSKKLLDTLRIGLTQHIVSRYAKCMQKELCKLDKVQYTKRLRHYQPDLVQYIPEKNERLININRCARVNLVDCLLKEWSAERIFHEAYMRLYEWAAKDVLNTPEQDSEYYEALRECWSDRENLPTDEEIQVNNKVHEALIYFRTLFNGEQLIRTGMLGYAVEAAFNMLSLYYTDNNLLSLDQLERQFGLVIGHLQGPNDIPIPTGDGPAAITEGLNAAANNAWIHNESGEVFYETNPLSDGLVVKLALATKDIEKTKKVMENLQQQLLTDIDPLTVRLNTLLCSVAETQSNPWNDTFIVDTRDLATKISTGRLGRLAQAKQAAEILKRVKALSQIKVLIYWTDEDKELTRETSNLWVLTDRAKWKPGQDESSAEPYRYELKLTPGNWVNHCFATENKHRDIHGTAYIPKDLLKEKHTLIGSMHLWYEQTQRNQFTISEWMTGIYGRVKLESKLQDRKAKSKFKKDVRKAVQHLKDKVEPSFKIIKSDNWWTNEVVKQTQPVQPIPISDLIKQLRQQKGLSQKDLGEAVNYSQSRISQIERDLATNPNTAEYLLEHLRRRANPE